MSTNSYFDWNFIANIIQWSKLNLRMQFKHPEILYFLFLLIVLLVHLFQFRRFKKSISLTFDSSCTFCPDQKSSKIKNGCYLAADYYCYPLLSSLLPTLFCSKDKENATNEMYIILDNSFSMHKENKENY
jgi:hypothetical protein